MSLIFCRGCGKQIHESAAMCPHCGAPNPLFQSQSKSGTNESSQLPDGVAGWSWGAFLLNWIWAIANKTWIGLLCLVPVVGFVMAFVLGFKGREWAWKNTKWRDLEHFNRVQRLWSMWSLIIIGVSTVIGVVAAIALPAYQDYVARALVTDAMQRLNTCREPESIAFLKTKKWANDNLYFTCAKDLPKSIRGYGKATGPEAIEITFFLTNRAFGDGSISLYGQASADGQIVWTCVTPNILQKYLGNSCTMNEKWKLNTELLTPDKAEAIASAAIIAAKEAEEQSAKLAKDPTFIDFESTAPIGASQKTWKDIREEWNLVQKQLISNEYLSTCISSEIKMAQEFGGLSKVDATERAKGICDTGYREFSACQSIGGVDGLKCYVELVKDKEGE